MTFDNFLKKAWADHASDADRVASRLADCFALLEKNDQIPALANLATHVFGEHLGRWDDGIAYLLKLRQHDLFDQKTESENAVARSVAIFHVAKGDESGLASATTSDQVRVLAVAAGALSAQRQTDRAKKYFQLALERAETGLAKDDPANRALAVTGNNLACALEEMDERSDVEARLMILAAETGRKYWEIAGSWKEVLWGEYRLVMTFLKARDLKEARKHAQICIDLGKENKAGAMEMFYSYESLAQVEKASGNHPGYLTALELARKEFSLLSDEDKKWCEESFRKL